jgi:hypothetical protein
MQIKTRPNKFKVGARLFIYGSLAIAAIVYIWQQVNDKGWSSGARREAKQAVQWVWLHERYTPGKVQMGSCRYDSMVYIADGENRYYLEGTSDRSWLVHGESKPHLLREGWDATVLYKDGTYTCTKVSLGGRVYWRAPNGEFHQVAGGKI